MTKALNLADGIKYWRDTQDPMLGELANSIEESGELPDEKELTDLLTFYLVFSIGCRELKLDKEAGNFDSRATHFLGGLRAAGLREGSYHTFMGNKDLSGLYSRIQKNAALDASYRMVELRNKQSRWR